MTKINAEATTVLGEAGMMAEAYAGGDAGHGGCGEPGANGEMVKVVCMGEL